MFWFALTVLPVTSTSKDGAVVGATRAVLNVQQISPSCALIDHAVEIIAVISLVLLHVDAMEVLAVV